MTKPDPLSFDWDEIQKSLNDLPPDLRERIEVPLRATNPRVFLITVRTLRDQLNKAIEVLEGIIGDDSSSDSGTRGE